MTPAVSAVLADGPLAARLALVVAPLPVEGSCATEGCIGNHDTGRKYCDPCRIDRDLQRRRRWWREHGQDWRARRAA